MSLLEILDGHVRARPDAVVIEADAGAWTFHDLRRAVRGLVRWLTEAGLRPGDRFAVLAKNRPEHVAAWLAAAQTGTVVVPLNTRLQPQELAWILADAGVRHVLVADGLVAPHDGTSTDLAEAARTPHRRRAVRKLHRRWTGAALAQRPTTVPGAVRTGGPVVQMYTSGTTGRPKGALLTEANLLSLVRSWLEEMPLQPGDRTLQVTPLFHVGAVMMSLCNLVAGSTLVLPIEFTPAVALGALSERGITHTLLVPAMIRWLLMQPGVRDRRFPELRAVVYGAAPMPPELLREAMGTFPADWLQGYGLTETAGVLTILRAADHRVTEGDPRAARLASAGQPLSCSEIRVVDAEGTPVPAGVVGEVEARGGNVFAGYHGLPADTARHDGWFCTGDAGFLDEQGYLFLVDRVKDMMLVGGENVYPREVERVLEEHPDVSESAVIGIPHAVWGEEVLAMVVLREGRSTDPDLQRALIRHCRGQLARYKCPTRVQVVPVLPRNAAGKVLKAELRAPFWQGLDRKI